MGSPAFPRWGKIYGALTRGPQQWMKSSSDRHPRRFHSLTLAFGSASGRWSLDWPGRRGPREPPALRWWSSPPPLLPAGPEPPKQQATERGKLLSSGYPSHKHCVWKKINWPFPLTSSPHLFWEKAPPSWAWRRSAMKSLPRWVFVGTCFSQKQLFKVLSGRFNRLYGGHGGMVLACEGPGFASWFGLLTCGGTSA